MVSDLNPAEGAFLDRLAAVLPPGTLRAPEPRYLDEPRGRYTGRAGAVAVPSETAQVGAILAAAQAARVPVLPYGGGTGLVGGQLAGDLPAPLILSLERMARIRAVDPVGNTLVAEAGAILQQVQAAAEGVGRLFPLSLASEGSARIGGLLATNAGGTGVLRWGNARALCLGIEAVTAQGQVWHGLKGLRKDNAGYDLRDLIIGSEGTLAVITAATLRLVPRPARTGAALFVVPSPEAALDLLSAAQAQVGEGVSAFELIAGQGLRFLAETMPQVRLPFADPPDWCVLVDLGLGAGQDPEAALEELFATGIATDGLIAASEGQRREFWTVRETIPLANRKIGAVSNHDISVPVAAVPEFIARAGAAVAGLGPFRVNAFGHLGDGNLHYNIFPPPGGTRADHESARPGIKRAIHDLVHAMGGSVAAEHGVGRQKVEDLERYADPVALGMMRAVKAALDPAGILNPGSVLRAG
jgi:FAD/FMN-containing dehydrogenase